MWYKEIDKNISFEELEKHSRASGTHPTDSTSEILETISDSQIIRHSFKIFNILYATCFYL